MAVGYKISKDTRKYKCPYCDYRDIRHKLVNHVSNEHFDEIAEEETAAKVVFDHLNKGRVAKCIICKKETEWDEEKWRYKRICSKECTAKFTKNMRQDHIKVHGVATLLNDEEHQKKMLNNRAISGSYKFSDGGIRTYVGSYERERLEFLDTVMGFSSSDVLTPGPTIEYEFNGKKHMWITDCYIVPFNLVIDDKPGGSNKNTHENMKEYFDKQTAKEESLIRLGKYNYVRLTDKDFGQLLEVMLSVKEELLLEQDSRPHVFINESQALTEAFYDKHQAKGITILPISWDNIVKYSDTCPELRMVRDLDDTIGAIFIKQQLVIGFICMDIQSFEITSVYQHDTEEFIYDDMIEIATSCWGANSIIIDKRNELVYNYHINNGWLMEKESECYCRMSKYKEDPINEAKVITTKDIKHNVDKWFSDKNNILFVTGLSGSGKSTLTRDLAKKYEAIHIELDWIDYNLELKEKKNLTKGEQIIKDYFEATDAWFDFTDDDDDVKYKAAYNYIISKLRDDTRNKYIVEGVHIFLGLSDVDKDDSIIIKCTSAFKSATNAYKRSYNNDMADLLLDVSMSKLKNLKEGIKDRLVTYDKVKKFAKSISEAMIGNLSTQFVHEVVGSLPPAHPHIVAYSDNGTEINGFGVTSNRLMDNTFVVQDDTVKCVPHSFFDNKYYTLLKYYNDADFDEKLYKMQNLSLSDEKVDKLHLFSMITGSLISSDEQVLYDDRFKQLYCSDKGDTSTYVDRMQQAKLEYGKMNEGTTINEALELLSFPLMSDKELRFSSKLLEGYDNLIIESDVNGYFVRNKTSEFRSVSYKDISYIQEDTLSIVNSF